jgi:exonuclease VII small subunit
MSLADYLDKLRKRRRKTAKMKDYIDVEATPHVEPKPKIPTPPAIHPAYTRTLAELERSASQLERQFTQLDAFLELLEGYEILELARTGITGLTRGSSDVKMFD